MPEKSGIKGCSQHEGLSISFNSKQFYGFFAVINHLIYTHCTHIHNTKKQAENIISSCSFLFLKTLFHFILQCTCISVPYLESGLCELGLVLDS